MTQACNSTQGGQSASAAVSPVARLLLIEDDPGIAADVIAEFRHNNFAIEHEDNGARGLARAQSEPFDAIIMDRMLPEMGGLSILSNLRESNNNVPVLVLSALGDVDERVLGFLAGGDDYLPKPFALTELRVRVLALLRRGGASRDTVLQVADLTLDLLSRTAKRGDLSIDLLTQEFKLLEYMMRRPGQVLSRDMLLSDIWNYRFQTKTNLVDVHIGRLRRKVDVAGYVPLIHTISGVGFILCPQT